MAVQQKKGEKMESCHSYSYSYLETGCRAPYSGCFQWNEEKRGKEGQASRSDQMLLKKAGCMKCNLLSIEPNERPSKWTRSMIDHQLCNERGRQSRGLEHRTARPRRQKASSSSAPAPAGINNSTTISPVGTAMNEGAHRRLKCISRKEKQRK